MKLLGIAEIMKVGVFIALLFLCLFIVNNQSHAQEEVEHGAYDKIIEPVELPTTECSMFCDCEVCGVVVRENHELIRFVMGEEFQKHRDWMVDVFFTEHIRYAMSLMTNQMTAVMLQQVKMVGGFFDAKHQLETQRIFQTLMAKAHEDYQPSEGMCDIGTVARGLIVSERKSDLVKQAMANRTTSRQLRTGTNLSYLGISDSLSRTFDFRREFCDIRDNGGQLEPFCEQSAPRINRNRDVDYTRTVDSNLTLNVGFAIDDMVQTQGRALGGQLTADESAVFALTAHLFAHEPIDNVASRILADARGNPRSAALRYQTLRSVAAKRNVAANSISAIIGERAAGNAINGQVPHTEYAPFVKSVVAELGVPEDQIEYIIGENPSYFAQMEVMTKKLYQNPLFYTELYDKPTNVLRKGASIRAIGLMQDRDFYKSLLRTESVLAITLEAMLLDEHNEVAGDLRNLKPDGEALEQ